MRDTFRLYKVLVAASIRAKMEYRVDFISSTLLQAAMGLYDFLIAAVILWRFRTMGGWDIWEIGLLYGISRVAWGLYRIFLEEVDQFEKYIVSGDFDVFLLRPWPSLLTLASKNIELPRLSWVLQGLAIGCMSAGRLLSSGALRWVDLVHLLGATLWTMLLYSAIGIATASAAFVITRIEELQVLTQNATGTAGLYPLDIYPNWLRRFLLYAIPIAVGNYIPVRYLVGKGGTLWSLVVPGVVSVLALFASLALWRAGEAKYQSTGT